MSRPAAALAALPGMHPARLRRLVDEHGGVAAAAAVAARVRPHPRPGRRAEQAGDPWAVCERRGTIVWSEGEPGYPIAEPLPDRPPVLFAEGDRPHCLGARRVAIVGTRAATPGGRADAHALAAFVAGQGVTVVSGLAIGIDGAAHEGALAAGGATVGVLATGLDVVYPRRHTALTAQVRANGLLVTEAWFGTPPEPWRFPIRNRIIAALADVVVVVEATERGGARITADHALAYDRPVLAVPGSRRNPAAAGCNALLADGAHPLLDPSDVLVALGLSTTRRGWEQARGEPVLDADGRALLAALAGEPATVDELALRCGFEAPRVSAAVAGLLAAGRARRERGFVWPV